jgi:hypothetical protein
VGKRSRIGLSCAVVIALTLLGGGVARAVGEPGGTRRVDPTTVTAPSPVTTSASWHFEGRHSGIEHFELGTERCPVLDHRLRETFAFADGTAWTFRAHYCGTIDARGVWTGVGSFTITTGSAATLSGTFTSSAQLPSVGVPYELDISAGTGTFAGARGSCVLDNHLRTIAFGVQHQHGIFVCDLDH